MSRLPEILELVNEVGERRLAEIEIEAVRVRPVPPKLLRDLARARPPSPMQVKILGLLADGHGQPEIAVELHLSHETVRTHVKRLRSKLGTRTAAQTVARGIQLGYLRV